MNWDVENSHLKPPLPPPHRGVDFWISHLKTHSTQAPRNMGDSNNAPLFEGGREALLSRGVSYYDPFTVNPADEETDYEYDKENRLVEVTLPSGVVVEFLYDGIGRRLSKVITDDTGDDTLITTWKYHWLGGQITTIEVDAIEDDGETQTAVRDETLHIHLGPNGQPLSFEWVRYDYSTLSCPPSEGGIQGGFRQLSDGNKPLSVNGQSYTATTLSDTYYYHYDIHGNVIKVTDSSATTKISYEYDVLGEISSVTNPDGITNPFAFRGGTQALYDEELELYFGGGYYRADLGTTLSSSGIASNPTSGATTSGQAQASKPSSQSAGEKIMAAGSGHTLLSVEEMATMAGDSRGNNIIGVGNRLIIIDNDETRKPRLSEVPEFHSSAGGRSGMSKDKWGGVQGIEWKPKSELDHKEMDFVPLPCPVGQLKYFLEDYEIPEDAPDWYKEYCERCLAAGKNTP